MSRNNDTPLYQLMENYCTAGSPEQTGHAWQILSARIQSVDDVRFIAETARANYHALLAEVAARKQLEDAAREGPSSLLPVIMPLGPNSFVVSQGRGSYTLVPALPDEDTRQPLIDPAELDSRGPCLARIGGGGGFITEVFWYDENPELFSLVLGQDQASDFRMSDDGDAGLPRVPVEVPVQVPDM